jgi:hypothetical protein
MKNTKMMLQLLNTTYGEQIKKQAEETGQKFEDLFKELVYRFINISEDAKAVFENELYEELKII